MFQSTFWDSAERWRAALKLETLKLEPLRGSKQRGIFS
jgi:hypothetical protein